MKTTCATLLLAWATVACAQQASPRAEALQAPADKRPQAQEERATAPQQPQTKAGQQAGPQQKQQRQQRRAVRQNIQRVPPVSTASPGYGPVLDAPAAGPIVRGSVPPSSMPTPAPPGLPGPAVINSCTGNTCTDAAGGTYNTDGAAGLNSQGRLCNKVGNTMRCF